MSKYDDIIGLEHHVSKTHPHMSVADRAAQFAPFAALTGYEEVIDEAGRLTQQRIQVDEGRLAELDDALRAVLAQGGAVKLVYFAEDDRKEGGSYRTIVGRIRKVDEVGRRLIMEDGTAISTDCIIELGSCLVGYEI
ncbi:MAG TPA: hypothetical protein H9670_03240 [Firmicutes bacterium]|nr:hypothetical protein [Bacillota bacterium]